MRRIWRPWRILLVILIAGLLGGVWLLWPLEPRWTIPCEELVGFDEPRGLLYTVAPLGGESAALQAWDQTSGQLRTTTRFAPGPVGPHTHRAWLLSSDGTKLAGCTRGVWNIDLFDVASGKLLRRWTEDELRREWAYHAINFSPDGRKLLVQSWATTIILDVETGQVLDRLEFTMHKQGSRTSTTISMGSEVQLSPDGRYLSASIDGRCSLIVDLHTKEVVGKCDYRAASQFSSDCRRLRFVSVPSQQLWHTGEPESPPSLITTLLELKDGRWEEVPHTSPGRAEFQGESLGFFPQGYATYRLQPATFPVLEKLPEWAKDRLTSWLGDRNDFQIQFWPEQGQRPARRFLQRLPKDDAVADRDMVRFMNGFGNLPAHLSPNGELVAFLGPRELAVWDTRQPRPWTFWAPALLLSAAAIVFAWPRRVITLRAYPIGKGDQP